VSADITDGSKLVRVGVVAAFLDVAPYTVGSLRRREGLPFVRVGGRAIRYDLNEVRAWLRRRRGGND
jgi:Helix-turn-helix domain